MPDQVLIPPEELAFHFEFLNTPAGPMTEMKLQQTVQIKRDGRRFKRRRRITSYLRAEYVEGLRDQLTAIAATLRMLEQGIVPDPEQVLAPVPPASSAPAVSPPVAPQLPQGTGGYL